MRVFDCAGLALIGVAVLAASVPASAQPARPSITSVSHLAVYAADPAKNEAFYVHDLGAVKLPDPEDPAGTRYYFSPIQFVEVLPLPAGSGVSRLDHAAFNVSDAEGMRRYLISKGIAVPRKLSDGSDGSRWFRVKDPEGTTIEFVQPPASPPAVAGGGLSTHIIHVGFTIHDRKLEDTFYRDVLGFRPYWAGGMKDDVTSWVSQQVPDGSDWLEYMIVTNTRQQLTQAQTGRPEPFFAGRAQYGSGLYHFVEWRPSARPDPGHRSQDRPRCQMAAQSDRSRRHPRRGDGVSCHRQAVLFALHRQRSGEMM